MAQDGAVLAKAREIIEDRRQRNLERQRLHTQEVYLKIPGVKAADEELKRLMSSVISRAIERGVNAGTAVSSAREESTRILQKRAALLSANGFPTDYTDEKWDCPHCRDTGYIMGKPCKCLNDLVKRESALRLSSMLDLKGQHFDNFDLSYYSSTPERGHVHSPRSIMTNILKFCQGYAEDFGENSVNLLFRGSTGLGKTFLSACIAGVVSSRGFSVVYDTAVSVFDSFEVQKFDRGSNNAEIASQKVKRLMNCDLLILDDLGTEMITAFTVSALYSIINSRLLSGSKTLISTNLSSEEFGRRYSPQIVSRIDGEFTCLDFAGTDIRIAKRERGLE